MATYTIRSGDTLSSIASRYHTTVAALAAANHISNPNVIYAGQSLTVPDSYSSTPAPAPAQTSSGSVSYTVKSGDSLSAIASRYGTTVAAIAARNGISNPNLIYVGQKLTIPTSGGSAPAPAPSAPAQSSGGGTYRVRAGDTLSGIASRYGTTTAALAQLNGISNPNLIYVGQVLRLPGGSSTPAPAPVTPPPAPSSGGSYTVKSGDTLSGIASRYGTTVSALAQLNGISNPNLIYVGQVLRLPNGVSGPGPVTPTNPTPGPTTGGISKAQLLQIMPNLSSAKADLYLPYLNQAMIQGGINTPQRQAMFLAQLAHESGQLRYFEEIASGAAYEGRSDLGNIYPGDGVRYKGRGPIQLTGRNNYRAAGNALGVDFENNPTLVATPEWGFKVAVWFWNSRNLNAAADRGDFDYTTYRINGGYNGNSARHYYWEKAKDALGI